MKDEKRKNNQNAFPFVPLPSCNAAEPAGPGECKIVDVTTEAKAVGIRHAMGISSGIYSQVTRFPNGVRELLRALKGIMLLGQQGWHVQLPIVFADSPSPCWVVCGTCEDGPMAAILRHEDVFGEADECLMQ